MRQLSRGIDFLFENSIFLILSAVIALIWANHDYEAYENFVYPVHFWINDVAMCFFFGMAAKEIWESFLPGGALSSPKQASLPIIATLGGMTGPAVLYLISCSLFKLEVLQVGWAIPCATDIAFSYLFARMIFGKGHPAIPFLLLLAIADDALGLIVLAVFYPNGDVSLLHFLGWVAPAMGIAYVMRRKRVLSFWPYLLIPGVMSWYGFFRGGIHPALALVVIVPLMPSAKADLGLFAENEENRQDTLDRFEHWWKKPVELILGLFGLVNAGVLFGNAGIATGIVMVSLLLGKPLGITIFTLIGMGFGLSLPRRMSMRDVIVLGSVAGVGFTVALFVATVALPAGPLLDAAKLGALASMLAAVLSLILAKMLGVRRISQA
ncbi:MAG: Na+/H+ antiporter NhaA [Candidatus Nomurabacteria bacterium]|nr:MAG: Na+/H+ antiporter NhaA [Candidatus Nomurabacteria bacterium]